jgi:hypothetical protein
MTAAEIEWMRAYFTWQALRLVGKGGGFAPIKEKAA